MSYQAYLDNIEKQTGKTPQQIIDEAHDRGFEADTKATEIIVWLKTDFGLGHGHAAAMANVIRKGPVISDKHVGSSGVHRDESTILRLDGIDRR